MKLQRGRRLSAKLATTLLLTVSLISAGAFWLLALPQADDNSPTPPPHRHRHDDGL